MTLKFLLKNEGEGENKSLAELEGLINEFQPKKTILNKFYELMNKEADP